MLRKQLCASIGFKGIIEGWTVKQVDKNLWRFYPRYDREDLMQEGRLSYWIAVRRYARGEDGTLIKPRHFVALYKRIFTNRLNKLARGASTLELALSQLETDHVRSSDTSIWSIAERFGGHSEDSAMMLGARLALAHPLRSLMEKIRLGEFDGLYLGKENETVSSALKTMASTVGVTEAKLIKMIQEHLDVI